MISSILPPMPVKADVRIAQIHGAEDSKKKFSIAHAFVEAKIARTLELLNWLAARYDIEREMSAAKSEANKLGLASTIVELRSVEAHVASRYWEAYAKILPESLQFHGRMTTSHQNNASDCVNLALNYAYGFLKAECRMAINSVGLESSIGFLHDTTDYQTKESLVYDLEEPFRFLCDLSVIQAFESKILQPHDFYFTYDYRYTFDLTDAKIRFRELLKQTFNAGITYKDRVLKWDTVIQEKANELARYLKGQSPGVDFSEPAPILERTDSREIRERILSLTSVEASELGIGKSTLHYLRGKARERSSFKLYEHVKRKLLNG